MCGKEHQHKRLYDGDIEDEPHPLDTLTSFYRVISQLFNLWVFKIVKIGSLNLESIPNLPLKLTSKHAYQKWKNVYNDRKINGRSTKTLSMIWNTKKWEFILMFTLLIIGYSLDIFLSFIFKNNLWSEFKK